SAPGVATTDVLLSQIGHLQARGNWCWHRRRGRRRERVFGAEQRGDTGAAHGESSDMLGNSRQHKTRSPRGSDMDRATSAREGRQPAQRGKEAELAARYERSAESDARGAVECDDTEIDGRSKAPREPL